MRKVYVKWTFSIFLLASAVYICSRYCFVSGRFPGEQDLTPRQITAMMMKAVGGKENWLRGERTGYSMSFSMVDYEAEVDRRVCASMLPGDRMRIEIETFKGPRKITHLVLISVPGKQAVFENGRRVEKLKDNPEYRYLLESRLQEELPNLPTFFLKIHEEADKARLTGRKDVLGYPCYILSWKGLLKEKRVAIDAETFYLREIEILKPGKHIEKYYQRDKQFGDVFFRRVKEVWINGKPRTILQFSDLSFIPPDESLFQFEGD